MQYLGTPWILGRGRCQQRFKVTAVDHHVSACPPWLHPCQIPVSEHIFLFYSSFVFRQLTVKKINYGWRNISWLLCAKFNESVQNSGRNVVMEQPTSSCCINSLVLHGGWAKTFSHYSDLGGCNGIMSIDVIKDGSTWVKSLSCECCCFLHQTETVCSLAKKPDNYNSVNPKLTLLNWAFLQDIAPLSCGCKNNSGLSHFCCGFTSHSIFMSVDINARWWHIYVSWLSSEGVKLRGSNCWCSLSHLQPV